MTYEQKLRKILHLIEISEILKVDEYNVEFEDFYISKIYFDRLSSEDFHFKVVNPIGVVLLEVKEDEDIKRVQQALDDNMNIEIEGFFN